MVAEILICTTISLQTIIILMYLGGTDYDAHVHDDLNFGAS